MIRVYELPSSGGLRLNGSDDIPPAGMPEEIQRWVRVVEPLPGELQACLHSLELSDAILDSMPPGEVRSRVVTRDHVLIVTLPVIPMEEGSIRALWMACTATTLITAEEQELPAVDTYVNEQCNTAQPELTLPGLVVQVAEAAAAGAGTTYLSLRRRLDALANAIENNPLTVPPGAILAMKRRVMQLSILWEDQVHGFDELRRHHSRISSSSDARELLRQLVADADRGLRLLAQMENRLRDLRLHQQHYLQESANRRLNMLTILSAIYLPATLIAGIYGMNFEHIPITRVPYGYFIVLSIMAALVLGQLGYFHRRGWFR
jgi:magnesium transporter